jgi:YVTN family beta-propeller protein
MVRAVEELPIPRRSGLIIRLIVAAGVLVVLGARAGDSPMGGSGESAGLPGMPPVVDPHNLYSEIVAGHFSTVVAGDLERVYVPERQSNEVSVIDPASLRVVDHFKVGLNPQHIIPSWDLKTLWVANNAEGRTDGSLTPIDPKTGKPGPAIPVDDPYNMYFMPDGSAAIVVAEEHRRLDLRDPHSMALRSSILAPACGGINHADFSLDGRFAIFTCEFTGGVTKIDLVRGQVAGYLVLRKPVLAGQAKGPTVVIGGAVCSARTGMPQDIRVAPDGKLFYVADMEADGVFLVDGERFVQVGFIPTGTGAHGLYPSRDGKLLYVANRGSHKIHGPPHGAGSISVISFASQSVIAHWPIPGGGSPDMGNVSADGDYLWLSGRFDDVVYRINTQSGAVDTVAVGHEPHGLTVWPQPGRYSLGHTGNLR